MFLHICMVLPLGAVKHVAELSCAVLRCCSNLIAFDVELVFVSFALR